jgi:hypothetical protein
VILALAIHPTALSRTTEDTMSRMTEIERPGAIGRLFYFIGKKLFGEVPTPERIMAHRIPLMVGIGALHGAIEWFGAIDVRLRALLQLQVARLHRAAY